MQEQLHLPDSSSLKVSISLARLKLSTIQKITRSKQVKNSFFKLCTPSHNKSGMDTTNDVISKNHVVQINSQCIIRPSDEPVVDNALQQTEGSEKVIKHALPSLVSEYEEEDLCVIIENTATSPDSHAFHSQKITKTLNKFIPAKHNLPMFNPLRRDDATAKKRDAITQTSKVHIVSEEDFIRLKYMHFEASNKFRKSSYTQTGDEVKKTVTDDVNNNNKSSTANDEIVNKLLSQSDRNKVLLNQFYKLPHRPPTRHIEHINVSNVINQVLSKIQEQYQESGAKLYYNKVTQTRITLHDNNILFSPVSDDEAPSSAVGENKPEPERDVPDSSFQCRSLPSTPVAPVTEATADLTTMPNQYYQNRPHSQTSTYSNTSGMMISALQLREEHQAYLLPNLPTNPSKTANAFPAAQNYAQQNSGEVAIQVTQYPQHQRQLGHEHTPHSVASAPARGGRGGANLRQNRKAKSSARHSNAPYHRAPCPQTFENYNMMMHQHKMHEFEMQQRAWDQLQNYPNSAWAQNYNRSQ